MGEDYLRYREFVQISFTRIQEAYLCISKPGNLQFDLVQRTEAWRLPSTTNAMTQGALRLLTV